MKVFADRVRERAEALGLANAEVARRAQIPERTFANYVLDRTEPNLEALLRISKVLQCSVDELLVDASGRGPLTERDRTLTRLRSAIEALGDQDLKTVAVQIEAIIKLRARR